MKFGRWTGIVSWWRWVCRRHRCRATGRGSVSVSVGVRLRLSVRLSVSVGARLSGRGLRAHESLPLSWSVRGSEFGRVSGMVSGSVAW